MIATCSECNVGMNATGPEIPAPLPFLPLGVGQRLECPVCRKTIFKATWKAPYVMPPLVLGTTPERTVAPVAVRAAPAVILKGDILPRQVFACPRSRKPLPGSVKGRGRDNQTRKR